jgi:chromosome segregation ATPase
LDNDDEDNATINRLTSNNRSLEIQIKKAEEDCEYWRERCSKAEHELADTKKGLAINKAQLHIAKQDDKEDDNEIRALSIKLNIAHEKIDSLENEIKITKAKLHYAQEDDKEDEQDIKKLQIKLKIAHGKIEEYEQQLKITQVKLHHAKKDDKEDDNEIKAL